MANSIEKYIKFWKNPFSVDSSFMITDVPWIGAVKSTGQAIHSKIQGKLINDNNVLKMVIPTVLLVLSNNSTLSIDDTITEITKEKIDELLGNISKSNVKGVVIGESVKTIGHDAFNGFSNLETVAMTDSVTRIEASAFSGCTKLVNNNIPLSKKIEYIGDYAF